MSFIVKNNTETISPLAEGFYDAVCIRIIDLGHQLNKQFGEIKHKLRITWLIPDAEPVTLKGIEYPRTISESYTRSLNDKSNLRKMLTSWRGRNFTEQEAEAFDLSSILGKACKLQILHQVSGRGLTYANVQTVIPPDKSFVAPKCELLLFDMSDPDSYPVFEKLPASLKKYIAISEDFNHTGLELNMEQPSNSCPLVTASVPAGTCSTDFTELSDDDAFPDLF